MREIKTAVITGASGMIGMALAQLLLSLGIKVAVCARPGSSRAERLCVLQGLYKVWADLD